MRLRENDIRCLKAVDAVTKIDNIDHYDSWVYNILVTLLVSKTIFQAPWFPHHGLITMEHGTIIAHKPTQAEDMSCQLAGGQSFQRYADI